MTWPLARSEDINHSLPSMMMWRFSKNILYKKSIGTFFAFTCLLLFSNFSFAHERWLLTPEEVMDLANRPIPDFFSTISIGNILISLFFSFVIGLAVAGESIYSRKETQLFRPLSEQVFVYGVFIVRIGLAITLLFSALGLSPRNGTELWTTPTLFVPDLQLSLLPDHWGFLAIIQAILSVLMIAGVFVRVAALGVLMLCLIGLALFGKDMIPYFGHFFAPAFFLLWAGPGPISIMTAQPRFFASLSARFSTLSENTVKRFVFLLTGGTFVYLGIAYKALQPTLLIAILEHGQVPTLGIGYENTAYIMALTEIIAGLLLALGILVRPIAVFLIFAMTFLAIALQESPCLHANIYALAIVIFMLGPIASTRNISASGSQVKFSIGKQYALSEAGSSYHA